MRGVKEDYTKYVYPNLVTEMLEKSIPRYQIALATGIDTHTLGKRFRGDREIRLWEAEAVKTALKSELPLEELFYRKI